MADPSAHTIRCANCSIRLSKMKKHHLNSVNPLIQQNIKQWIPGEITDNDCICSKCWELANLKSQSNSEEECTSVVPSVSQQGHSRVCVACGRSVLRKKRRLLLRLNNTDLDQIIVNVICGWIFPRQINVTDESCVPCWLKAKRVAKRKHKIWKSPRAISSCQGPEEESKCPSDMLDEKTDPLHFVAGDEMCSPDDEDRKPPPELLLNAIATSSQDPTPITKSSDQALEYDQQDKAENQSSDHDTPDDNQKPHYVEVPVVYNGQPEHKHRTTITLPSIRRAPDSARKCLFHKCTGPAPIRVPNHIRHHVLRHFNFYIPNNARICSVHLRNNHYHELYAAANSLNEFTAAHIEEMISVASSKSCLNFENIGNMDDHLIQYFIGLTREQFQEILDETPRLNSLHNGRLGLAAVLCKLKTGDSGERLSSLFQIPRRTLECLMGKTKELLKQDYIPRHPGILNL